MRQLVTPNPNIPCAPGWCLQYVRQAYGLPAKYASATEAWEKSTSQHRDRNFPAGLWVPVWYGLVEEPLGHVVLLAPDGSCYSTSDLGSTPHHHPDLADLEAYYAYYGMTLTYRGWTEDVSSYPVIGLDQINLEGSTQPTTTPALDPLEEIMAYYKDRADFEAWQRRIVDEQIAKAVPVIVKAVWDYSTLASDGKTRTPIHRALRDPLNGLVAAVAADKGISAEQLQGAIDAAIAKTVKVDVTVNGKVAL